MQSNISEHCSSVGAAVHAPALGSWSTREEARKFWEHFICDECVYFAQPFDVNTEIPHIFAEKYVGNDMWFHIGWTEIEAGQAGNRSNEAVIEAIHFDKPSRARLKPNSPVAGVNGDSAVFVEVPKFVQLPEMVSVHGIRSVVRLKRIESAVDAGMEQGSLLPVGVIGAADRKDHVSSNLFRGRNSLGKRIDQVPCKLVEGCAETVNKISNCKTDLLGDGLWRDYEKVQRSIRIVFFDDRIRVALNPVSNLLLGRLEVKVSPSGFHVDVLN